MGTDATYDDLSTREMEEDTHEFIKEETKNGFNCEVVKTHRLIQSQASTATEWFG